MKFRHLVTVRAVFDITNEAKDDDASCDAVYEFIENVEANSKMEVHDYIDWDTKEL